MLVRPLGCAFVLAGALSLGACAPGGPDIGVAQEGAKVCPKGPVTLGVDVSHYDGTIDWTKVKADSIDFAFMKATESTDFFDPTFTTNWTNAGAAGVIRGAYHFYRASADPIMQADYFVGKAGVPQPGDLPLVIDLETLDGQTAATTASGALQFLQRVESTTGRTPIIYTGPSFFTTTLGNPAGFDHYILWIANWQVSCPNVPSPPWSDWAFWQNSDSGMVTGIPATGKQTAVDLDQFNGTLSDLQDFVNPPTGSDGGALLDAGGSDAATSSNDLAQALPGADAGSVITAQKSGCSCQLAGRENSSHPFALFGALALFAALSLRRRRRAA